MYKVSNICVWGREYENNNILRISCVQCSRRRIPVSPKFAYILLCPSCDLQKKGKIKNSKKITKIVQLVSPSNLVHLKHIAIAKENSPESMKSMIYLRHV